METGPYSEWSQGYLDGHNAALNERESCDAAHKWSGGTRHARLDNTRKIKRFKRIICSDACANAIRELEELTYAIDRNGEIIDIGRVGSRSARHNGTI